MADALCKLPRHFSLLVTAIVGTQVFLSSCTYSTRPTFINYDRVETVTGLDVEIGEPFGIAIKDDIVYFSDGEAGEIRRIDSDGRSTVFAGGLNTPSGIAFLPNGDLVVADTGSHTIRTVNPEGAVSILAGVEKVTGLSDGAAHGALFNGPTGVATNSNGDVYVTDTYNDRIRVIERHGVVATLAGSSRGFSDGIGSSARFDTPLGVVLWGDKLIVADSANKRLRVVESNGDVWTLAGTGNGGLRDGTLSSAEFVMPTAVTVDRMDKVFIADGNSIRVIGRRTFPFVETLAGDGRGSSDGDLKSARFNRPSGLAVDSRGDLYIADSDNRGVRVVSGREKDLRKEFKSNRPEAEGLPLADRWPYDPPMNLREVAGTMGEIRGEIDSGRPVWFHNGLDIAGAYGETAKFIRGETVLAPLSAENFGTARELLRLPSIGYIHLRLGRDQQDQPFGDPRFQFDRDASGKLTDLRIPRGAYFAAGDTLGTLNSQNHVHLIAGRQGDEINALAALVLPGISDSIAPIIEDVSLFDQNWHEIETEPGQSRIKLTDRTRIVARAYDRMDGNSERRRLGVYKVGYQVLPKGTDSSEINWTIVFDRMPSNDAVRLAYAPGSQSGYTGQTIFNYIASNRLSGDHFAEEFLDPASLPAGAYVLRVFAADFFGNTASKDIDLEVVK